MISRLTDSLLLILSAAIVLIASCPVVHAAESEIHIEPLAEGLYAFRAGAIRSFFMIGDDGVLIVDPVSPDVARAVRKEIAALTDKPVSHVVYSHSLNQRSLGGRLFKKEGARFVAQEKCAANFRESARDDVVMPDDVFAENYTVDLGGLSLDLYYLGRHYDCSIVMITRPDNLMFVVGTVRPPAAMVPADPSMLNIYVYNLINFLDSLEALARQQNVKTMIADQVVFSKPGEAAPVFIGPTGSSAVIGDQRAFWQRLFAQVREAKAQGVGGSVVGKKIDHTPYQNMPNYNKEDFPWVARRVMSMLWTGK